MSKTINWISEAEASEKLGYKARTLRLYVKRGVLNIAFYSLRGRKYHYSESDIIRLQNQSSTLKAV